MDRPTADTLAALLTQPAAAPRDLDAEQAANTRRLLRSTLYLAAGLALVALVYLFTR